MSDETKTPETTAPEPEPETPTKPIIPINHYVADKIMTLANKIRSGEIIGFDLAWNLGAAHEHPHKLFGAMLMQGYMSDEYLNPPGDSQETLESIQREINKALKTPAIVVEDRTAAVNLLGPAVADTDDEDEEDFHITSDDDSDED